MRFFGSRVIQNVINLIKFVVRAGDKNFFGGSTARCPHCAGRLYRIAARPEHSSAVSDESPAIQSDGQGHFMICPHCLGRIALMTDSSAPGGIGYGLGGQAGDS